jgi:hypothetical protein
LTQVSFSYTKIDLIDSGEEYGIEDTVPNDDIPQEKAKSN